MQPLSSFNPLFYLFPPLPSTNTGGLFWVRTPLPFTQSSPTYLPSNLSPSPLLLSIPFSIPIPAFPPLRYSLSYWWLRPTTNNSKDSPSPLFSVSPSWSSPPQDMCVFPRLVYATFPAHTTFTLLVFSTLFFHHFEDLPCHCLHFL